jgi:hypothetical protein
MLTTARLISARQKAAVSATMEMKSMVGVRPSYRPHSLSGQLQAFHPSSVVSHKLILAQKAADGSYYERRKKKTVDKI